MKDTGSFIRISSLLHSFLDACLGFCVPLFSLYCVKYRIFQLKVGGAASDDIERIHAVRAILDAKVAFPFAQMLCFI